MGGSVGGWVGEARTQGHTIGLESCPSVSMMSARWIELSTLRRTPNGCHTWQRENQSFILAYFRQLKQLIQDRWLPAKRPELEFKQEAMAMIPFEVIGSRKYMWLNRYPNEFNCRNNFDTSSLDKVFSVDESLAQKLFQSSIPSFPFLSWFEFG